jgi:hypothetical protein
MNASACWLKFSLNIGGKRSAVLRSNQSERPSRNRPHRVGAKALTFFSHQSPFILSSLCARDSDRLCFYLMLSGKRLVLSAAGFGGGFAIVAAALVGGLAWYESRPKKLPEWNTTAIKATFKDVVLQTSVPKPKIVFSYSLENTTNDDYLIDHKSQVAVMATMPEGKGFEPDETLMLPASFYIPANQKVVLAISKEYEYSDEYPERDRNNVEKLAPFMNRRLRLLDGFVLFDKARRYKIALPNGWPDVNRKHGKN